MFETLNEYYEKYFKFESHAKILRISNNKVYLDQTIFYAESGGQECDIGILKFGDFEFKIINVQYEDKDTNLWKTAHYISTDQNISEYLKVNDEVELFIDINRRNKLSAYHTASHLLFIAAEQVRNGIQKKVIGCHIKEDSARFDFITDEKFNEEEILSIQTNVNKIILDQLEIKTYFTDIKNYARVWECDGVKIPCGGTHLKNTSNLNFLKIKRKGIGKGKERLICIADADHILKGNFYA